MTQVAIGGWDVIRVEGTGGGYVSMEMPMAPLLEESNMLLTKDEAKSLIKALKQAVKNRG